VKGDRHPDTVRVKSAHGFTLIELMVVMVIVGILATGVVFMFANPSAKVKNQAFTLLGELNMGRSEAVSENLDVRVEFLDDISENCQEQIANCTTAGDYDGYLLCLDTDADTFCTDESADDIIRTTIFARDVQYYDPTVVPVVPTGGPAATPGGANLIGKSGILLDDVAATEVTTFFMEPDGTLEDGVTENINVIIYVPKEDSHNKIYGTPYAIIISPNTGGITLKRWTDAGAWGRK
jgi:prepilin-type N-terminal cleavage/methylation domain-containing protein